MSSLRISILPFRLAVARLGAGDAVPPWVRGTLTSVTRTPDELSIICDEQEVPHDVRAERGWRAVRVEGPIPFEMTGVAAALVAPLAAEKISVFLFATFDTDYLLLKEDVFARAVDVLRAAGHDVS